MAGWAKEVKDTAYKMRFAFLTVASVLALSLIHISLTVRSGAQI